MDFREFDLETAKEISALRTEIKTLKSLVEKLPCAEHEKMLNKLTAERDISHAYSKRILHFLSAIIAAIVSGIVSLIINIMGGK